MPTVIAAICVCMTQIVSAAPFVVGSKRFTESFILGEIIAQTVRDAGDTSVQLKSGMGNTSILLAALKSGEIDVYPEYTGTIAREILKTEQALSLEEINARLAPMGLRAGVPLGFNNSYVLAIRSNLARSLNIKTISDLSQHPTLILGLSHEFIGRADGWRGLSKAYGLEALRPRGLDHGLAYEAIAAKKIDLVDAYGTDSKLSRYALTALQDDRHFFPSYEALLLFRAEVPERFPVAWQALQKLEHSLTQDSMLALNTRAEIDQQSFSSVAKQFLQNTTMGTSATTATRSGFMTVLFGPDFWRLTGQHLFLVLSALALASLAGIPLGLVCFYAPRLGQVVLAVTGVMQTIPSLAVLAFLITVLGTIGTVPAIVALFLYALLPIVQNTHAGLKEIPSSMRQAATALGITTGQRLWLIELPLARGMILSGVKISAVLCVGTATIAAFIGAGGFGERIVQGLALNNTQLLLAGAIPAAGMALLMQGGFFLLEKYFTTNVPDHA
ncbi:glycine betaine ABC transporter substrate-binding protein [Zwartia sp.]|uniref:glycine betaine ABC transporter substrate-binding protein n=1 Tax=Zwartia sp. TaxID=2978004 RepID=UPI003BB021E6